MHKYLVLIYIFLLVSLDAFAQNEIKISVSGACGMCKTRIEQLAKKEKGVIKATYRIEDQVLILVTKPTFDRENLVKALLKIGHDAEGQRALDADYQKLHTCCHYRNEEHAVDQNVPKEKTINSQKDNPITLTVRGACDMCTKRIESTALNVIGVQAASYNLARQELKVTVQEIFQLEELIAALVNAGHETNGVNVSDAVYQALPTCCQYKDEPSALSNGLKIASGMIFEMDEKKKEIAVIGALVSTPDGFTKTLTSNDGSYTLTVPENTSRLVVQFIGYSTDTFNISNQGPTKVVLSTEPLVLPGVEIIYRRKPTEISFLDPVKVQKISAKELLKAACCNLAESFDTTPAVDASMTDAITGTRRIEMLGLAGPYVQITRENMPDVRGLAAVQGLAYTPGPWITGMQLNQGAGSVINGFESISGQINIELLKPCHEEEMHLNAYANQASRYEANSFQRHKLNDRWSTANLLHLSSRSQRRDHNHDNFMDMPLGKQLSFVNRWKWSNNNGQEGQIGAKITYVDNISGEMSFDPQRSDREKIWGADMTIQRAELWAKRGFVNIDQPYKSIGFQASATYHDQKSQFGLRRYDATQKSLYFNSIYQTIIANEDHQVRVGASAMWDQYHEIISDEDFRRNEFIPGIFSEYTYKGSEKFTLLVGGRADYHNNFGLFFTPRLNIRYAIQEKMIWRIAIGKGQRTQSVFAENIGVFASNRDIIIRGGDREQTPYGLDAERAWTFGSSFTYDFEMANKPCLLSIDLHRVNFENQIVLDLDESPQKAIFYNLKGESFANNMQVLMEFDPLKSFHLRLAYRYNDVKTTYGEQLLRKPLISPHRAFVNTEFEFGKGWTLDFTINYLTGVRIPSTSSNPSAFRWANESPNYFLANSQISKNFKNGFAFYIGGENIFNYKLHDPIISSSNPFGPYFDASLAWGPIFGVNIYGGVRYTLMSDGKDAQNHDN
jgi:copper chaperone CopZ